MSSQRPSDPSSVLQQGYLQVHRNGENSKVFAILTAKNLVLYPEDPAKFPNSTPTSSIDISKSKLIDEGNFKRPKSFGVLFDQGFLEFSCATNSARSLWLKSVESAKASSDSLQKLRDLKVSMDYYRAPVPVSSMVGRPSSTMQGVTPSVSSRPSSEFGASKGRGTLDATPGSASVFSDTFSQLRMLGGGSGTPYNQPSPQSAAPPTVPSSSAASSLIVQPKVAKRVSAKPNSQRANNTVEPKELPRWVPGNYRKPGNVPASSSGDPRGVQKGAPSPQRARVGPANSLREPAPGQRLSRSQSAPAQHQETYQPQHQYFTPMPPQQQHQTQPFNYHTPVNQQYAPQPGYPQPMGGGYPPSQPPYNMMQTPYYENSSNNGYPSATGSLAMPFADQTQPSSTGGQGPPTSMEHFTIAQIRAALMTIPVPIRSALMAEDSGQQQGGAGAGKMQQNINRAASYSAGDAPQRSRQQQVQPSSTGRKDFTRPVKKGSGGNQRPYPSDTLSDDGSEEDYDDHDNSSLDSGYIASGGKKKQQQYQQNQQQQRHGRSQQQYSKQDVADQDDEAEDDGPDEDRYHMAAIYENTAASPEPFQFSRNEGDYDDPLPSPIVAPNRSSVMKKAHSTSSHVQASAAPSTRGLRRSNANSHNGDYDDADSPPRTQAQTIEKRLGFAKRPNPLQRAKSAPVPTRPSPKGVPPTSSHSPLHDSTSSNKGYQFSGQGAREDLLEWSKRQARDKRIGASYFGNTKKGAQLMQGSGPLRPSHPQQSQSKEPIAQQQDQPPPQMQRAALASPLRRALPLNKSTSLQEPISNPMHRLKGTAPSTTVATAAAKGLSSGGGGGGGGGGKSFFDFKKSSKTADLAMNNQLQQQQQQQQQQQTQSQSQPKAPLLPQQQEKLEAQLRKYQQDLQRKRMLSAANATGNSNTTNFQLEYAKKRDLAAPTQTRAQQYQQQQIKSPMYSLSRSTSFHSNNQDVGRPRRLSAESNDSFADNNINNGTEMTDMAEWQRFHSWLETIGMEQYTETLRENGVAKLSVLELLTGDDLAHIGINSHDAQVILQKANELTQRIQSFSEHVLDDDNHKAPSVVPSSRLMTPTSSSHANYPSQRRFVNAQRQHKGTTPTSLATSTSTAMNPEKIELLKQKLLHCYTNGDLERFFALWERLPTFPKPLESAPGVISNDIDALLRSERPALHSAKQAMEFHLHLYFCVYALKHQLPKIPVLKAKAALRRYLDTIAQAQEDNHQINSPEKPPAASSAELLQQLNLSVDVTSGNALLDQSSSNGMNSPDARTGRSQQLPPSPQSPPFPDMKKLFSTREYATFAGLVFVPHPQQNPAFQPLFRDDWAQALYSRLERFLEAILPPPKSAASASPADIHSSTPATDLAVVTHHHQSNHQHNVHSQQRTVIGQQHGDEVMTPHEMQHLSEVILKPAPIRASDLSVQHNLSPPGATVTTSTVGNHSGAEAIGATSSQVSSLPPPAPPSTSSQQQNSRKPSMTVSVEHEATDHHADPQYQQAQEQEPEPTIQDVALMDVSSPPPAAPPVSGMPIDLLSPISPSAAAALSNSHGDGDEVRDNLSPTSSISQLTDDTPLKHGHHSQQYSQARFYGSNAQQQQYYDSAMQQWLSQGHAGHPQPPQHQTIVMAKQRPAPHSNGLRSSPSSGSPRGRHAQQSSLSASNSNTINNVSSKPGLTVNKAPVMLSLNQRNLMSIQQQAQLQQFQQQFGYTSPLVQPSSRPGSATGLPSTSKPGEELPISPISPEHEVTAAPTPSSTNAVVITTNTVPSSTLQASAAPSSNTPASTSNAIQINGGGRSSFTSVGNNVNLAPNPTNNTTTAAHSQRPKSSTAGPGAVSSTSGGGGKTSLQAQVDNYNKLLKMNKLKSQQQWQQQVQQPSQQPPPQAQQSNVSEEDKPTEVISTIAETTGDQRQPHRPSIVTVNADPSSVPDPVPIPTSTAVPSASKDMSDLVDAPMELNELLLTSSVPPSKPQPVLTGAIPGSERVDTLQKPPQLDVSSVGTAPQNVEDNERASTVGNVDDKGEIFRLNTGSELTSIVTSVAPARPAESLPPASPSRYKVLLRASNNNNSNGNSKKQSKKQGQKNNNNADNNQKSNDQAPVAGDHLSADHSSSLPTETSDLGSAYAPTSAVAATIEEINANHSAIVIQSVDANIGVGSDAAAGESADVAPRDSSHAKDVGAADTTDAKTARVRIGRQDVTKEQKDNEWGQ